MEPKFQSSFIPKGPVATSGSASVSTKSAKKKSILNVIAFFMFVVAVAGSLGVFGYNFYLKYRISKMGADIEAARSDIQPGIIEEITRMESRLDSTSTLLKNHVIISSLFEFLEKATVKNVRFTELKFETTKDGLELKLDGQAQGYSAVALQSNILNESENFDKPVFSNLRLDNEGNVIFSFSAYIKPELLSYSRMINASPVIPTPSLPEETSATSTTATSTPTTSVPTASSTPSSAPTSEAILIN